MELEEQILHVKRTALQAKARAAARAAEEAPPPTKAKVIIRVKTGGMEATLLLHPTSPNTAPPIKEEILEELARLKVVYGLNLELLEDLCVKPVFYHIFVIAQGIPPTKGRDGQVRYLVSQTADRKPVIGEDGVADYKNINFFRVVKKGQVLCEITHPEKGEDGLDVFGCVLEGKSGAAAFNPAGKNTDYNPEKTQLISLIDGHLSVHQGMVHVVEVLMVGSGVNHATGNIDFVGDVVVGGDVAAGFSIKCSGSIVINGSVEGASLDAGTDINISTGMLGMDIGSVSAGGDIKCEFIQNCNVRATGSIYANSVLFSKVECGGDLVLGGKKAALIGGSTLVGGKLQAKTIGSPNYPATEIQMGSPDLEADLLIRQLTGEVEAAGADIQGYLKTLSHYEELRGKTGLNNAQTRELIDLTGRYQERLRRRLAAEARLEEVRQRQAQAGGAISFVECTGKIYPNAKIHFGPQSLRVEDVLTRSRIQVGEDGVIVRPL